MNNINLALEKLTQHLTSLGPISIAVSGGVDSMTLAVIANRAVSNCQIYHAISPAVPPAATERVKRYAKLEGWKLEIINAKEIDDPEYVANPANRCYFCKSNLYTTIDRFTDLRIASGTNLDDLSDYRPGLIAADESQVIHPYVDMGIDKDTLRSIAKYLLLNDLYDLPAAPCLSSRVTTGLAIDAVLLPLIAVAEEQLWALLATEIPLKGVRCRIRPSEVAIEIESNEALDPMSKLSRQAKKMVSKIFRDNNYEDQVASVTIEKYKRGSAFLIETLELKA
ncbi:MAG: hypothetical protein ACJAVI_003677 [Candidatus Azotimanducaceae bacterium]|jgi:uncharacterized protein